MAKRKIKCTRFTCKHNQSSSICTRPNIEISCDGCDSFEKGFAYYTNKVWNALDNSNMIMPTNMNDDLKIGIYYVCRIWGLVFSTYHRADWLWYGLCQKNEDGVCGNCLTKDEITALNLNEEAMMVCYNNFNQGILPNGENEDLFITETERNNKKLMEEKERQLKQNQIDKERLAKAKEAKENYTLNEDWGFITPSGNFIGADWGLHEDLAWEILDKNKWGKSYWEWREKENNSTLARDYLIAEKGYCLIHSPSQSGYNVTYIKPLTKHQRDYLFDYFAQRNESLLAFHYGVEKE